jgi:hypothetical protein
MLVVGVWPVLLHLATDLWAGLRPVNRDIQDRLYSRFAYICTKVHTLRHGVECVQCASGGSTVPAYLLLALQS